jgi:predicted transcriptional regulator
VTKLLPRGLSKRERQIMQILYERGRATVADVQEALPDPPSYSAVRRLIAILEEKGQAKHTEEGGRYVYSPAESWTAVSKSAIEQVVESFFGGSVESAVATLLTSRKTRPSDEELARLEEMIQRVRAEEHGPAAPETEKGREE